MEATANAAVQELKGQLQARDAEIHLSDREYDASKREQTKLFEELRSRERAHPDAQIRAYCTRKEGIEKTLLHAS